MMPNIPMEADVVGLIYITSYLDNILFCNPNEEVGDGYIITRDTISGKWCIAEAYIIGETQLTASSDWVYLEDIPGTIEIEWLGPDDDKSLIERDFEKEYLLNPQLSVEIEYVSKQPDTTPTDDPFIDYDFGDTDTTIFDYDDIEKDIFARYGIKPGNRPYH